MNRHSLLKIPTSLGAVAILLGATLISAAQVTQTLHETINTNLRDDYTGTIGCVFQTGSSNVVVSHLGIYDSTGAGLAANHHAGIFTADGSTLLGSVAASAGTVYYYTNGYQWISLDPPLLLSSNTTYLIAGDVVNGDGDSWNDATTYSSWNPYFVGSTPGSTRNPRYSTSGAAWPTPPTSGWAADNTTYGNVSLAFIEEGKARVGVASTNIAVAEGQPLSITGFASGAPGITYQWFKGTTPVNGQTSSTLTLANPTLSDTGTYYLTATNSLGGERSAAVAVSVSALPVGISAQPTNFTAIANYTTATFSMTVTGTPPISIQWSRNGVAIPGANSNSYSFIPTSANDGDAFSCVASNYISGTPHVVTSENAILTVIPNLALPEQFLHGAVSNLANNSYVGCVGGSFVTGSNACIVTHLGYYAANYTDATHANLVDDHTVYIFNSDYTTNASVVVTHGSNLPVINGYIWARLNPPVTLAPNTTYILGADTTANDPWGDSYTVPDWNSYYTDPAQANQNLAKYNSTGMCPYYGGYNGQIYSAPNMAIISSGSPAVISLSTTSVTQYEGLNINISAVLNGAPPVTGQWYKDPNVLLSGETNADLVLNNVQTGDSGNYYLLASNALGTVQSSSVAVTVLPNSAPGIVRDISSQTVYPHTTVNFNVVGDGTPPLSYQWSFNNKPIPDATNASLTVLNASSSSVGSYRVTITNSYGSTPSSVANLSLINVPWGSYPSAVMSSNLIAYYRFSGVSSGFGIATNQGSLGFGYDGTNEGFYSSMSGPTGMSHFEPGNLAINLDGFTSDVSVPAFNVTLTNATIAAWVYSAGGQPDNSAIYFERGSSVCGLSVFGGTNTLKYSWPGGSYFNFQTGLTLPTNQWTLVAMSVATNQAVIYLQDGSGLQSVTNVAPHTPATFDNTSYIGWDTAGGDIGRRWLGGIDEVMVFNRALTATEVNALYLGVPGSATINITRSGSNVTLTWPGGVLLESTNVLGPWTTNSSAVSPYTVPSAGPSKYYRVKLQ